MVHLVRGHEKDGEVADRRKMGAHLLVGVGPRERRRIGVRQTLSNAGMLLFEDAKNLVLAWKALSVRRRYSACLERIVPSGRQLRAQPELLREVSRRRRKVAQRPGRMVHHAVRLLAHLVLRQV